MPDTPAAKPSIRLDKRVAELFGCSREDARRYVEGGWVTVDGETIDLPQTAIADQRIELAPDATTEAPEPATMLLHKPAGHPAADTAVLVTPQTRDPDDPTGIRVTGRHYQRLEPLMPIDNEASGLLVLSQDGRVRRRLVEDYARIEQEFVVEVSGQIAPYGLHRLAQGLSYRGRQLPPCKVSWQNEIRLRFAIKAVQQGQLRHMCSEVDLGVVAIRRIRIGRISLGKLPVGTWRSLPVGEKF